MQKQGVCLKKCTKRKPVSWASEQFYFIDRGGKCFAIFFFCNIQQREKRFLSLLGLNMSRHLRHQLQI